VPRTIRENTSMSTILHILVVPVTSQIYLVVVSSFHYRRRLRELHDPPNFRFFTRLYQTTIIVYGTCVLRFHFFFHTVVVQKLDPIKCFFIRQTTCPRALLVYLCKYIFRIFTLKSLYTSILFYLFFCSGSISLTICPD